MGSKHNHKADYHKDNHKAHIRKVAENPPESLDRYQSIIADFPDRSRILSKRLLDWVKLLKFVGKKLHSGNRLLPIEHGNRVAHSCKCSPALGYLIGFGVGKGNSG